MPKNDTQALQRYFFEYIKAESVGEKQAIIEDCKEDLPSFVIMIDRIKNVIDELNDIKETKINFINKVFNIQTNSININLLNNMESQIENKTVVISTIKNEGFVVTSFDEFVKNETKEQLDISSDDEVVLNNNSYVLNKINKNGMHQMNYLFRKLFKFAQEEILFAEDDLGNNYIISENQLPEMCVQNLEKEESLCDKKNVWIYLENTLGKLDSEMKVQYLRMIFLDIITNQNYRILRNGTGILESDNTQNDYYVLNGVTLKKEFAIESFFENYYDEISDISDLINDNYGEILDLIVDLIKNNQNIDEKYLLYLRENIVRVYEKRNLKIGIQKITENYREDFSDIRNQNNEMFKMNMENLRNSLDLKSQVLTKSGYASILTIVLGIIACGFGIAYLMLMK